MRSVYGALSLKDCKFNLDKGSAGVLENVGTKALEKVKFIFKHCNTKGRTKSIIWRDVLVSDLRMWYTPMLSVTN